MYAMKFDQRSAFTLSPLHILPSNKMPSMDSAERAKHTVEVQAREKRRKVLNDISTKQHSLSAEKYVAKKMRNTCRQTHTHIRSLQRIEMKQINDIIRLIVHFISILLQIVIIFRQYR